MPKPLPVAVVELFTSEGCSSCPPADENLAELTQQAERSGERVLTLERHVDYWDDLGWKDPFSAPEHAEAQRRYAARFGRAGIYTPQMIVNGREELIGSERATARDAIRRALSTPAVLGVSVVATVPRNAPGSVRVDYRIDGQRSVEVTIAVLEDVAETNVMRGENARRRLRHRHVVRALTTRTLTADGTDTWTAAWPRDASSANRTALVYASDRESLAVLGAAGARVE